MSRWPSKVLPERTRLKSIVSPSAAAAAVSWASISATSSSVRPYLRAIRSAWLPSRSAGASGSSSNERQTTVTSSRCSNCASAAAKRARPT